MKFEMKENCKFIFLIKVIGRPIVLFIAFHYLTSAVIKTLKSYRQFDLNLFIWSLGQWSVLWFSFVFCSITKIGLDAFNYESVIKVKWGPPPLKFLVSGSSHCRPVQVFRLDVWRCPEWNDSMNQSVPQDERANFGYLNISVCKWGCVFVTEH